MAAPPCALASFAAAGAVAWLDLGATRAGRGATMTRLRRRAAACGTGAAAVARAGCVQPGGGVASEPPGWVSPRSRSANGHGPPHANGSCWASLGGRGVGRRESA
eukprot:scaffold16284_cov56-Phaeocystis_antarctica.AAC.2